MIRPFYQFTCLAVALCAALNGLAADSPGVQLLRSDSLDGWRHSAEPARGWTIKDGRLAGSEGATPLLGGWTLGDFELRFDWSVSKSGKLLVELPKMPAGDGMTLSLAEGKSIDLVTVGERVAVSGKDIAATKDGAHTAVLKRDGGKYMLSIDGKTVGSGALPSKLRLGLMLSVAEGEASISNIRLIEPAGQPIFNGRDLTGWWTPGNKKAWVARDGEIVLAARGGNYLRTEKLHANYTFSFEYRTPKNTNSGVGIRTAKSGWPSGDGMELQIHTSGGLGYGAMMSLYRNVPPLARGEKIEDWNRVVVKADGRMITAWVNGVMTQHCNTAWEAELKHRHLTGWIGFQDHGRTIRIRNLNVLTAPDGLGMDGWYTQRDLPAARVVLDRLMNTDRLARDDGIVSAAAGKKIDASGEQVIAELKGPGGVVRVTALNPKGNVALYFDDEETPRLQCPLAALGQNVPRIAQQGPVLLTYVGYKSRLRIVATGAAGSTVRVEYVRLPKAENVTSWSKTDNAIPRGVLAALDYRRHQHSHGTFRQNDPYERPTKQGVSIAAGKSARVIARKRAGLIHFVQFHGNKKHLANDDLWIEVRVDGQSDPALAAPLRYYYAPLASGGNFNNYLFTERGGQVCRLAMPFDRGIQIDLVNRGKKTIGGVGLTASIQSGKQFAKLMRLRGVFVDGGEIRVGRVIRQTDSFRLVGLVAQVGDKPAARKGDRVDGELLGNPAGDSKNFRNMLSGQQGNLAWRYLLLAPLDFKRFEKFSVAGLGDRLVLFYVNP